VALRKTFVDLGVKLDEMFRSLDSLYSAALFIRAERVEGLTRPIADSVVDAQGFLADAQATLAGAQRAMGPPLDLEGVRLGLVAAKESYLAATEALGGLASQRLEELETAGLELGRGGPEWSRTVRDAFDQCSAQAWEVVPAFFACFEEISERAGTGVSVQTTSIGQQVNVGEEAVASTDPASLAAVALSAGARAAASFPASRNPGGQS